MDTSANAGLQPQMRFEEHGREIEEEKEQHQSEVPAIFIMDTSANAELQPQRRFEEHGREIEEEQEQHQDEFQPIFLSHSRAQKDFVEQLYEALKNSNHSPFFDVESLRRGEVFPPSILRAAENCKLGVVVLSHEYMMSKWPMRELEIFTKSSAKILPVFYKLTIEQVKSPMNMVKWKAQWERFAAEDGTINPNVWEKNVKSLLDWGSDDFSPPMREVQYINKIVRDICNLIPPPLPYNLRYVRGRQHLAEGLSQQFEAAESHCKSMSKACVIGIFGVGGLGKTTICKIMANYYCQEYLGRSEILEFPSNGDGAFILEGCKKVLRRLTHVSEDHALKNIDNFDKAVQLMQGHMKRYGVFLAIDNVWENSLDKARHILECGYDSSSKVLVTSRSKDVLQELLKGCDEMCIACVPSLNETEALSVIQDSGNHNLKFSSQEVERVLRLGCFDNRYHPLALKALGRRLMRNMDMWGDATVVKGKFFSEMGPSNIYAEPIDLLRSHFDDMPDLNKRIFLDVVLFFRWLFCVSLSPGMSRLVHIDEWNFPLISERLSNLYEGKCSGTEISDILRRLELDGLLEIGGATRIVLVHDLYIELAKRVAHESCRFLLLSNDGHRGVEAMKPERVSLMDAGTEELALVDCSRVELLQAKDVSFKLLRLESMTSLRSLVLCSTSPLKALHSSNTYLKLKIFLSKTRTFGIRQPSLGPINLRIIHVEGLILPKRLDLSGLIHLQVLLILRCGGVEAVMVPPAPSKLRQVMLMWCPALKHVPDWGGYSHLEELAYEFRFQESQRINALTNLHVLHVSYKKPLVFNLISLAKLQTLTKGMEGLGVLTSLRDLYLSRVKLEARCQELEALTNLENLYIHKLLGMKRFLDLKALSNLRGLEIRNCPSLEKLSHFGSCPMLQHVYIRKCKSFKEMEGLQTIKNLQFELALTHLKYLLVEFCPNFKGYDDTISAQQYFGSSIWGFKLQNNVLEVQTIDCRACSFEHFPQFVL